VTAAHLLVSLLVVAVFGLALVGGNLRLGLLDEVLGDVDDVEDETLDCEKEEENVSIEDPEQNQR